MTSSVLSKEKEEMPQYANWYKDMDSHTKPQIENLGCNAPKWRVT